MDLKLKNNSELTFGNYIPVEYIESTGYPNIDTGISWNMHNTSKNKVDCIIQVFDNESSTSHIYKTTDNTSRITLLKCNNSSTSFLATSSAKPAVSGTSVTIEGKSHIIHTFSSIIINDTSTSITGQSSSSVTYNMTILPSSGTTIRVRFWKFDVYDNNGNLAAQFIPAISLEEGHEGEACFYDKTRNIFKYSSSTGSFTASNNILPHITTAYIKDCPMMNGIDILRACPNLTRVRLDIGDVSGALEELQHYATLSGYSDNYEEQTKPRIVGNFTINTYHTNEEKNSIDIDGLVLFSDNDYNVDYLLDNNLIAIQTVDENEEGYNQPVANVLNSNDFGHTISSDSSKFFITKNETAAITSLANTLFRDNSSIITFNEFKYWAGLTSLTNGGNTTTDTGAFGNCTSLESIEIPEGITKIGNSSFCNDSALSRIVLPSTLNTSGANSFTACNGFEDGDVYFNGTLLQWMNITFETTGTTNPTAFGSHLYIQGTELTSLEIPSDITSIKYSTFRGCKYITGQLIIPSSVTSIANYAFTGCSGLTSIDIQNGVTSIGQYAFSSCTGLTGTLTIPNSITSVPGYSFYNCTGLTEVYVLGNAADRAFQGCTGLQKLVIYGNSGPTVALDGGNGTGTLEIYGSINTSIQGTYCGNWKNIIVHGDVKITTGYGIFNNSRGNVQTLRINGSNTSTKGNLCYFVYSYALRFVEINGTFGRPLFANVTYTYNGFIEHLGNSSIAGTIGNASVSSSRCSKVYVGDGTSRSNDEAVLALYLADTNWSAYSAKLGTWYDYNGEYKWYYITDNLTNCTNTNPDEWPHITRGESYETTIVPDEGMTINSLTVEMLDTDTTSPTYDTYIPQPTSYDSATGIYTISIPSVTGNVVITASAS